MRLPLVWLLLLACCAGCAHGHNLLHLIVEGLLGRKPDPSPPQPMKLIGAGLGRTGTSSLVVALRTLGFKPYHMAEGFMQTPGHAQLWAELVAANRSGAEEELPGAYARATDALIGAMATDGFNATTDFPAAILYGELLERWPEAKVLLTLHPKGGCGWAKSVRQTIGRTHHNFGRRPFSLVPTLSNLVTVSPFMWRLAGVSTDARGELEMDAARLADVHDRWAEHVIATVPASQLLVHSPRDGYAPICTFLRIPASDCPPDGEYPHVNDGADLGAQLDRCELIGKWFDALVIGLALALLAIALWCCTRPGSARRAKAKGAPPQTSVGGSATRTRAARSRKVD
jgi:hypothetical protein